MWFKQIQLFQLTQNISGSVQNFNDQMEPLAFSPCLPSLPSSMGWISPLDGEDQNFVHGVNGCYLICLQFEEKILPASVIAESLKNKVKQIETHEARRVRNKEKLILKDEVVMTLLPRAFTKINKLYAYIDTRHQWLVLNTTSASKTELFISMFKKSFGDSVETIEVIKPSAILTHWLKEKDYPQEFSIDKSCILQDPNQQHRIIRCQQQDLFVQSIQSLVKEGCAVIQLALCWQDKINFVMAEDFSLRNVRLSEEDIAEIYDELETKQQKITADLIMMSNLLAGVFTDLLATFTKKSNPEMLPRFAKSA
jgi:recombination associated protein RdgC